MKRSLSSLTSQTYWEQYYASNEINREKIVRICSVYDSYWELLIQSNGLKQPKSLLEIGGYPGRYLAYLASKYTLVPTCLDYNSDRDKLDQTFESFGIPDYKVIQADFLTNTPTEQYDLVLSNGFIEHFVDFNLVMDNHVGYLKKGGTMLIMIPNKRWLRKWYGLLVDRSNLRMHNLKCMNKKTFRNFATRNNLELLKLSYFGGFPYSPHQSLNFIQKIIYHTFRAFFKRVNPLIERYPNPFLSSTLIAVFKK